jgi:hypothetical protein
MKVSTEKCTREFSKLSGASIPEVILEPVKK